MRLEIVFFLDIAVNKFWVTVWHKCKRTQIYLRHARGTSVGIEWLTKNALLKWVNLSTRLNIKMKIPLINGYIIWTVYDTLLMSRFIYLDVIGWKHTLSCFCLKEDILPFFNRYLQYHSSLSIFSPHIWLGVLFNEFWFTYWFIY